MLTCGAAAGITLGTAACMTVANNSQHLPADRTDNDAAADVAPVSKELIEAAARNNNAHSDSIGRGMKVAKEQIVSQQFAPLDPEWSDSPR